MKRLNERRTTVALLSVKTFKARPETMDDLVRLMHDAKREMLRVDPRRTVRIFQVLEGPEAGNVSIMIEYKSLEAFREIRAKEQTDPGWQAIGERANGPDRPAETLSYVQMQEIG
jgi:hypothetical protein